jgi:hypothetical protein
LGWPSDASSRRDRRLVDDHDHAAQVPNETTSDAVLVSQLLFFIVHGLCDFPLDGFDIHDPRSFIYSPQLIGSHFPKLAT